MCKLFFSVIVFCLCFLQQPCFAQVEVSTDDLLSFEEPLYLEVIVEECKLVAYKKIGAGLEKIAEFPVAPVRKGAPHYPEGTGAITNVELDPSWYPTEITIMELNKKLISKGKLPKFKNGDVVAPGDPENAMGTFKMILSHWVQGKGSIYRIHGTNAPQSIGQRKSSGCIRMKNETGLPIAKNIQRRLKNGQIVEVNIVMKKS